MGLYQVKLLKLTFTSNIKIEKTKTVDTENRQ